jgi:protein-S-isoprenylcysteine O-methyltransferase Ste14
MVQVSILQLVALIEVLLCWVAWFLAFVKPSRQAKGQKKTVRAPASRWGIGLVSVAFALIWMAVRPAGYVKSTASVVAGMILAPLSVALAWAAARELGKQWRYEAALTEDHELIQSGPYRWVRHPIYASMFGMLMATAAAWSWWPFWIAGAIFYIAGTEIRVAAEERLLAGRFGESFAAYRSRVRAYVPFIR